MCATNNINHLPPLLREPDNDSTSSCPSSPMSESDDRFSTSSIKTILELPYGATLDSVTTDEEVTQQVEGDPAREIMEIEMEMAENEPECSNTIETVNTSPYEENEEEVNCAESEGTDLIKYLKSQLEEFKKLGLKAIREGNYRKAYNYEELQGLMSDCKYNLKLARREHSLKVYWAKRDAKRGRKQCLAFRIRKSDRVKAIKNGTYSSI